MLSKGCALHCKFNQHLILFSLVRRTVSIQLAALVAHLPVSSISYEFIDAKVYYFPHEIIRWPFNSRARSALSNAFQRFRMRTSQCH